jgi:hypothetical protein
MNAMGHVERPLAEVFSAMPRCAPLRLSQEDASGGPLARPLPVCTRRTQERVAFALGGKLLPFLYKLAFFTRCPCFTHLISTPGADFALSAPRSGSQLQKFDISARKCLSFNMKFQFETETPETETPPSARPLARTISFRYNQCAPRCALSSVG